MKSSFSVSMICAAQPGVRQAEGMRPTYLVELDNIGVADLLEDFYFSRDAFNVLLVVDLFFLQDFDCHLSQFITHIRSLPNSAPLQRQG